LAVLQTRNRLSRIYQLDAQRLSSNSQTLAIHTGQLVSLLCFFSLTIYSQNFIVADELLSRLQKLKVAVDAEHRVWKSFRQASKMVWSKKELDDLSARLSSFRDELQFHILISLKLVAEITKLFISEAQYK
jgi:hypothetical protein